MPETAPHLSVQLRHRVGALDIDVDFQLFQPWTILFGPSGSGKTTILRAIAGLIQPRHAHIVSKKTGDNITLIDTSKAVCLPAHKRGIPLAAQQARLFPHQNVLENITYGYRDAGSPGGQEYRDELISTLPGLFHIEDLLQKYPRELSGGEAQRVSLARAAVACTKRSNKILLLDEPFAGLDLPLRDSLASNLSAWQQKYKKDVLSVTHDIAEAFQLDAEVIKLSQGRIIQQGPVATVLAEERARLLEQLSPSE